MGGQIQTSGNHLLLGYCSAVVGVLDVEFLVLGSCLYVAVWEVLGDSGARVRLLPGPSVAVAGSF